LLLNTITPTRLSAGPIVRELATFTVNSFIVSHLPDPMLPELSSTKTKSIPALLQAVN